MSRLWIGALSCLVVLTGCGATPSAPRPSAPASPTVAVTSVTPSAPASPTTGVASDPPVTHSMPAADGGPMLWPTVVPLPTSGDTEQVYGFVDAHGKLVIPERYDGYAYCVDAHGRAALLIATRPGHRAELYDLSGRLIRRAPTAAARCGGAGHIIFEKVIDAEAGSYNDGLIRVADGAVVVQIVKDRHLLQVDSHTVNVSDPSGEYLLDLVSRRRTPHAGWLAESSLGDDPSLLVASSGRKRPHGDPGRAGVLDRSGRWLIEPKYGDVSGFTDGHAVVSIGDRYGLLDARTHKVGELWDQLDTVYRSDGLTTLTLGYVVTRGDQQALLGTDLRPIVALGAVTVQCDWHADGLCSVVAADGKSSLVELPSGATKPMPDGYSQVMTPTLFSDRVPGEDGAARRLFSSVGGTTIDLPALAACESVSGQWASCTTLTGLSQTMIFDSAGRRMSLADISAVAQPSSEHAPTYYWVTAGPYRGFVDANGTWRYRDSRYTRLED